MVGLENSVEKSNFMLEKLVQHFGNRFFISHTAVPKVKIEVPLLTVCSLILNIY